MRRFNNRRDFFAERVRSDPYNHLREPVEIFCDCEPTAQM